MKTATFPSVRVEPELREAAEHVLLEGESLSGFVEQSIRESIVRRTQRSEFIARGLVSGDEARKNNDYISAEDVMARLEKRLNEEKARRKARR